MKILHEAIEFVREGGIVESLCMDNSKHGDARTMMTLAMQTLTPTSKLVSFVTMSYVTSTMRAVRYHKRIHLKYVRPKKFIARIESEVT